MRIRAVLDAQAAAWNLGDIDGFMEGYARSSQTTFVSGDEVTHGWQTVRDRYAKKYDSREKMGRLTFSDLTITTAVRRRCGRPRELESASAKATIRTGNSRFSSASCRKAGGLCSIIRRETAAEPPSPGNSRKGWNQPRSLSQQTGVNPVEAAVAEDDHDVVRL